MHVYAVDPHVSMTVQTGTGLGHLQRKIYYLINLLAPKFYI